MPHLPDPKGPYAVGATTFLRPIKPSFALGTSKVKKPKHSHGRADDGNKELEHTLQFEEVAFTVFYPASIETNGHRRSWFGRGNGGPSKGVDWVIKPTDETIKGYEHFGGQSYPGWLATFVRPVITLLGSTIKIPAYHNAPPLDPPSGSKWPLLIFSHGLAGSRTTYSHLCGHLASQGRVVLALEHRDGTGPAVFPRGPDGQPKSLYYVNPNSVLWPNDKGEYVVAEKDEKDTPYNSAQAMKLRVDQLELRRREVYEACDSFKNMVEGDEGALEVSEADHHDWSKWRSKVDTEKIDLVGHSFGGATVFSLLSNSPPTMPNAKDRLYAPLPIRKALALDPWMGPFPSPGPHPLPSTTNRPPLLVLNSEGFTLWNSHFSSLQRAVDNFQPGRILTLVGAQHISFSDFPLLVPARFQGGVDAMKMLGVVCKITDKFLDGDGDGKVEEGLEGEGIKVREMDLVWEEKNGKRKSRLVGEPGDVVVHQGTGNGQAMRL
ncbi:alpha/beta-hydrolase [Heliocybe sulcata]|uniref:Putative phospholipase n=1 Tax=Heliocybe sulcata TaxID=5364 RepID=A0A5C3MXY0_9AGAM|nr:alpha/beta-hydrolase [Heliocybe sulcata]